MGIALIKWLPSLTSFYQILLLERKLSNLTSCSPLNCLFSPLPDFFAVPFVIAFPCKHPHFCLHISTRTHLVAYIRILFFVSAVFNFLSGHFILNLIQIKAGLLCEAQKFNLSKIWAGFSFLHENNGIINANHYNLFNVKAFQEEFCIPEYKTRCQFTF